MNGGRGKGGRRGRGRRKRVRDGKRKLISHAENEKELEMGEEFNLWEGKLKEQLGEK